MPTPPRPARSLPPVPNLEQQKKQARELLDAARAQDPVALGRFRTHHPRWTAQPDAESLALHDAQLVLAREYGFSSWTKLKAHIDAIVAARRTRPLVREIGYYEDRAHGLVEVLADGASATLDQVRSWHPRFADASDDFIRAAAAAGDFTIDDARLVYAREHGFPDWGHFAGHLDKLARGISEEPFIEIVEAGKGGDWRRVNELLRAHPELIGARGTNGNTLLNLASSLVACRAPGNDTADEDPPLAADRLAPLRLLLAAGGDADQANDRGWTPLHQAGYRNDPAMARLLLDGGARPDLEAHGPGGTPLVAALFWGNRQAADVLAAAGIVPFNLRVAAGLGRVDLIHRCFTADGALTNEARAARGFYRPHSGFPTWKPSDDPQEVLDEALVWAAKSDRTEAMAFLVEKGARINADPYRGTALLWAAAAGRIEAARWLLDRGADVNQRATFGGPQHGKDVTALHLAAQNGNLEMVRFLVERRADPTIRDGLYESTPAGWAAHSNATAVAAFLNGLAI